MYVSSDKGFSDAYSTEKMGQNSPKTTVVIPIIKNPAPLDVINKVAKKLNYDINSFSQAELIEQKGVKEELAKLGYDGAIVLNDFLVIMSVLLLSRVYIHECILIYISICT
jgi:hypothetical protein